MSNERYIRAVAALEQCEVGSPDYSRLELEVTQARAALVGNTKAADGGEHEDDIFRGQDAVQFRNTKMTGAVVLALINPLGRAIKQLQREVKALKAKG